MSRLWTFLKKNYFILVLLALFIAADVWLTRADLFVGSTVFNQNDFEITQSQHPEKTWDKVFFGSSVVTASYIEEQSESGYVNLGVDYGTVRDIYELLVKGYLDVGSELVIGLNDISFMDELDTNQTYIWHKDWYEPYLYFQRDRLYPFLTDGIKNLLNGEPFTSNNYVNQTKPVYHGAITDEELQKSEQSMLDRFGGLTLDDCKENFRDLQRLVNWCRNNGVRLRAVWMPWNERVAVYDAAQTIMDAANGVFEANGIEVLDVLNAVPVKYYHDIGHLDYETGAVYFTRLIDGWLKNGGTDRVTVLGHEVYACDGVIDDLAARVSGEYVKWWYDESTGERVLFLPSSADPERAELEFTGCTWITVDGQPVYSGESIALSTGEHEVCDSENTYMLSVMRSEYVGAAFIGTSSGSMQCIDSDPDHEYSEPGSLLLIDAEGAVAYDGGLTQVKGRGNSTWQQEKKPYQIKLEDKTDLFGLGKSKTWLLLANSLDESLCRNMLAYGLAAESGLPYSPDSTWLDLYLNGVYNGTYQLSEKVEVGGSRVDIRDLEDANDEANPGVTTDKLPQSGDKLSNEPGTSKWVLMPESPEDITGGYLLELDFFYRYTEERCGFVTDRGVCVVIKSPEYASEPEVEYISGFVQDMEDAIYGIDGKNKKGKHYSEYIDADELAARYAFEEFMLNGDCQYSSFFLSKDSDSSGDGLLHPAPVWDYDYALGNDTEMLGINMHAADSVWVPSILIERTGTVHWLGALAADESFAGLVRQAYTERLRPALAELLEYVAPQWYSQLRRSALMNYTRWDALSGEPTGVDTGKSFVENMTYLCDFVAERMEYFDNNPMCAALRREPENEQTS